jgi:hypothetical protein
MRTAKEIFQRHLYALRLLVHFGIFRNYISNISVLIVIGKAEISLSGISLEKMKMSRFLMAFTALPMNMTKILIKIP